MNWIKETWKKKVTRSVLAVAFSVAMIGGFGTYELLRPAAAHATPSPATASPLDDNSVGALLSVDHAMETLAAR